MTIVCTYYGSKLKSGAPLLLLVLNALNARGLSGKAVGTMGLIGNLAWRCMSTRTRRHEVVGAVNVQWGASSFQRCYLYLLVGTKVAVRRSPYLCKYVAVSGSGTEWNKTFDRDLRILPSKAGNPTQEIPGLRRFRWTRGTKYEYLLLT